MGLPILSGIAEAIVGGLDHLFTSDKEREEAKLAMVKELNRPHHLQALANIQSASHPSRFVAGARPFVMWVCGIAFAYATVLEPIIRLVAQLCGYTGEFPILDTELTYQTLMALMGLGAMRSYDKSKGVDTKEIKK